MILVLLSLLFHQTWSIEAWRPPPYSQYQSPQELDLDINQTVASLKSTSLLHPILLIPGFAASSLEQQLENKPIDHWWCSSSKSWHNAWISLTSFLPEVIQCWLSNFSPHCTPSSCSDSTGVTTRPISRYLGDTLAVEHLDPSFSWKTGYMYKFIETLERLGHGRGKKVFAFPYDWRHSMVYQRDEIYPKLKELIEYIYIKNNNTTVQLVSHSMGGLIGVDFLSKMTDDWKSKYISELVAVGPPFSGSSRSIKDLIAGNTYGVPTVSLELSRQLVFNWSSISTLSPRTWTFKESDVLAVVDDDVYTAHNLTLLFQHYNISSHVSFLKQQLYLIDQEVPPNVKLSVFGTSNLKVPHSFRFSKRSAVTEGWSKGDGTVSVSSMIDVLMSWSHHQSKKIDFFPVQGVDHSQYFMNAGFVKLLIQYLGF
ncbi:hypothetical protein P9112_007974 [Eukaryota sp. TZLM1-RC]